ncbi:P-loop containing nucleoside triphosphate hydrolase protein [Wallemia mellicola]|nr:P-loop containing nucleoside triphosphate hydrolase protein [Wallemia mellicola]
MDIQEILKKQEESKQNQLKPKFLSKSQREALALEKRQNEHLEKQKQLEKQRKQKEDLDRRLNGVSSEVSTSDEQKDVSKKRGMFTANVLKKPSKPASDRSRSPQPEDPDMKAIKSRYLGEKEKRKRKTIKITDAKRMNFDWDEEEDTEASIPTDYKPLTRPKEQSNEQQFVDHLEIRQAKRHGYDSRNWREKELSQMTERDWRIVNEDFNISARGGQIPRPLRSWEESAIPAEILDIIKEIGYKEPSAIQRQAIPIGLNNRDLIGIAETGSGKTASFVIPMMNYISKLQPIGEHNYHLGPYALILAPTRELAQQIESETKKFAHPMSFNCLSLVGGKSLDEQSFNLRTGVEIIIATPGRLKDLLERSIIVLSQCNYLVLDEADRMVAMGFEQELTFILDQMGTPEENIQRQTFLYSATMPSAVEKIARKYLRKPATINIGGAGQAVDTVEQVVELIDNETKKTKRLIDILNSEKYAPPIIVFVNQKRSADVLAKELTRARWECTTLHSGKTQDQREEALQSLRDGVVSVLVATDLAGRGIDVADVSLVCNYHMANNIESYIHRIGRTGRAGKKGKAITFLTPHADDEVMYDLKQELDKSPISQTPRELATHEFAQRRITRQMKKEQQREKEAAEMAVPLSML